MTCVRHVPDYLVRMHRLMPHVGMAELLADSPAFKARKEAYPGFFQEPRNVIVMLCADGATICQNENSIWPIVCQVLNLPAELRTKYEKLLWYGFCEGKPKTRLLYEAFVDDALQLWETGCPIFDASTGVTFTCKFMVHVATFDYKGLVDALLHKDVGGYGCCYKCRLLGLRNPPTSATMYANRFHPEDERRCWENQEVMELIQRHESIATGLRRTGMSEKRIATTIDEVRGNNGYSLLPALARLPYFNLVRDVLQDHMHMFQNLSRNIHSSLHGDDWKPELRAKAKMLNEHRPWWPEVPLMTSPFAVPFQTVRGE